MPGPGLIAVYLDALAGQLPGAGGGGAGRRAGGDLTRRHLGLGLAPDAAAQAMTWTRG